MVERSKAASRSAPATREQILRAASRLFQEKGYFGASTRDIAKAVGIRQQSLSHHFGSKRAIIDALLAAGLEEPLAFAQEMARQDGSPAVRLYRYVRFDTAYLCRSPYELSGLFDDGLLRHPGFRAWRRRVSGLPQATGRVIREGIDLGEFVDIDVDFAAATIDGLVERAMRLWPARARHAAGRTLPDLVASFALRALLVDPSALPGVRRGADLAGAAR